MTNDRGEWFCTVSGRKVHVLDPMPEDILIEDIAHSLSHVCRFGGHVAQFYSVAQHSVGVSRNVPKVHARAALLHDAAEAYIGDVIRPLKQCLPDYMAIERLWERVIVERFELDMSQAAVGSIKLADVRMLLTERRDVAPREWQDHTWKQDEEGFRPYPGRIRPLSTEAARALFLDRWDEVTL
jgi:hypothetical protein